MPNNFLEKILLATDGSEDAALAAQAAAQIAHRSGAELHLVHVWQDIPSPPAHAYIERELKVRGQEILYEQVAAVERLGATVTERHLVEGRTADAILWLADRIGAGLIVLGSRGLGRLKRLLVGSIAEGVVHGSRYPVLMMRGGEEAWPPVRLVLGDDGSEAARSAGNLAATIGRLLDIEAILVRVFPELPQVNEEERRSDARMADDELRRQQRLLEERARALEVHLGHRPKTRIAAGDAAEVILDTAEAPGKASDRDEPASGRTLIAVGSRGLGLAQRLRLGSVSTKVLNTASGPVLIHPAVEEE